MTKQTAPRTSDTLECPQQRKPIEFAGSFAVAVEHGRPHVMIAAKNGYLKLNQRKATNQRKRRKVSLGRISYEILSKRSSLF